MGAAGIEPAIGFTGGCGVEADAAGPGALRDVGHLLCLTTRLAQVAPSIAEDAAGAFRPKVAGGAAARPAVSNHEPVN